MRVGPDGLPQPWAAESVTFVDRPPSRRRSGPDMTWHDGKPVTVEDVIFSFEAPAGDKSPMYKPFVANIASDRDGRRPDDPLQAEGAERGLRHLDAGQDQPDPEARLGADPRRQPAQGKNAEAYQEPQPIGSGPFKLCASSCRRRSCWRRTRATGRRRRWTAGSCASSPNTAAALGMLRSGEINFLSDYPGDPKILDDIAKQQKDDRDRVHGRHGLPLRRAEPAPARRSTT